MGEVLGTFILILLGDGVVANVGLAPRLAGTAHNWNTITIGWAFAVIVAVAHHVAALGARRQAGRDHRPPFLYGIPDLDHLVPDDVAWEHYCDYAHALKRLVGKR